MPASHQSCAGRVAVVTGAGNGLGRAHALSLAAAGAKVVVNDIGGALDGTGASGFPAQSVVDEIVAGGGEAVADTSDISTMDGAGALIGQAIDTYGNIDVLVNNAGILRDRTVVTMSEAEWDAVIAVHLKGTFATVHHAAKHWRARSKQGLENDARVINTSSTSGLFGSFGQTNYGAAKAGIAAFTIIASIELAGYGVTVNAIAPTAMTRMSEGTAGIQQLAQDRDMAPESVSPVVVWLGSPQSRDVTGRVFAVIGGTIAVLEGWVYGPESHRDERWTVEDVGAVLPDLVARAAPNADVFGKRPGFAAQP
ncbi:SDR family oxidoreductase [Nocardia fusca]|uniref:SDR family oxidoreductase n=1 Tax=Nocardia fusca TaxID=941183 RepID=UPI003793AE49